jgi:hypothetical protein
MFGDRMMMVMMVGIDGMGWLWDGLVVGKGGRDWVGVLVWGNFVDC